MGKRIVLVDGHVHIYKQETVQVALDAASRNFFRHAGCMHSAETYGLLLLADPGNAAAFEWICDLANSNEHGISENDWRIVSRPDQSVVHLAKRDSIPIAVLSGRQLVSSEGLEVLVFPKEAGDGVKVTAVELIAKAVESGGLAIIPWGAGKWVGRRNKVVQGIIESSLGRHLAVGDNGGRPHVWRRVKLLEIANDAGRRKISGSDPFPLPGEIDRIGSFGGVAHANIDPSWTSSDFHSLLCDVHLNPYGEFLPFVKFAQNQISLRFKA